MRSVAIISLFAIVIHVCVAFDEKACWTAFNGLKDGNCDDTKLVQVNATCGNKMKDFTCEKVAEHQAKMKVCTDTAKAAAAKCDDTAVTKVKEACGMKEGSPSPTCDMIKSMVEQHAKKNEQ